MAEYGEKREAACAANDIVRCDPGYYDALLAGDYLVDGVHPNENGHGKMYDKLVIAVPEPSTAHLLMAGTLVLFALKGKRQ